VAGEQDAAAAHGNRVSRTVDTVPGAGVASEQVASPCALPDRVRFVDVDGSVRGSHGRYGAEVQRAGRRLRQDVRSGTNGATNRWLSAGPVMQLHMVIDKPVGRAAWASSRDRHVDDRVARTPRTHSGVRRHGLRNGDCRWPCLDMTSMGVPAQD
jgi:hypothetical protein